MKKTILLAGIIASMTTMANVTGFVEGNAKGDVTFAKEGKETKVTGNIEDLSVKGDYYRNIKKGENNYEKNNIISRNNS